MMRFRVKSTVLGPERVIDVFVYQTRGWMRRVCHEKSGDPHDLAAEAATHAYVSESDPRDVYARVYLCVPALRVDILAHELHHATLAIYGASLDPQTLATDVLTNHNEDLAYLFSDTFDAVLEALTGGGYDIEDLPRQGVLIH